MKPLKILTLKRITSSHPDGTFGVLFDEHDPFIVTLERHWVNNQVDVSCIPPGEYLCQRVQSEKFGDTFEVTCVPNRVGILFHKGNYLADSHGCILLGSCFGSEDGHAIVESSAAALAKFLARLKDLKEFKLIIEEV